MGLEKVRVERRASLPKDAPYQDKLQAELPHRLPDDAFMLALPCGSLLFLYRGLSYGLALAEPRKPLLEAVMSRMTKMRAAGTRFEVARDGREAWRLIKEMGIPLKAREETPYAARDMFREESKQHAVRRR